MAKALQCAIGIATSVTSKPRSVRYSRMTARRSSSSSTSSRRSPRAMRCDSSTGAGSSGTGSWHLGKSMETLVPCSGDDSIQHTRPTDGRSHTPSTGQARHHAREVWLCKTVRKPWRYPPLPCHGHRPRHARPHSRLAASPFIREKCGQPFVDAAEGDIALFQACFTRIGTQVDQAFSSWGTSRLTAQGATSSCQCKRISAPSARSNRGSLRRNCRLKSSGRGANG